VVIKMLIAVLYLAGVVLLMPGFLWIVPEGIIQIPKGPVTIVIPAFGASYASGVHLLILGMALVTSAALLEFCQTCGAAPSGAGTSDLVAGSARQLLPSVGRAADGAGCAGSITRLFGPGCQVLGSLAILAGCIVFLPQFSQAVPPVAIAGMKAPNLGKLLFQVGSAAYFVGAVAAIRGLVVGARARPHSGCSWALVASLLAFILFLLTSSLLFSSSLLPSVEAVRAGVLRVVGATCLLVAVVLLCGVTVAEVLADRDACRGAAADSCKGSSRDGMSSGGAAGVGLA